MYSIECHRCKTEQDTTDWVEHFNFNDEIFEVECSNCYELFKVKVDITPEYEVVGE